MIAAIVAAAPGASAQRSTNGPLTNVIIRDDGTPVQLPSRAGGFSLFAEEDLAGTSLRLTGTYRYAFVNAGGLCPFANTAGDIFNTQCGAFNGSSYFHVNPVWGIGLGDYSKIVAAYPGVARMRAPIGFSTPWRITSIAPITRRIDAADGQFGQFFSGVTSLAGAGCRDMTGTSGAGLPANFTLTASQDCPDTWAATGFDGVRQIPDSVWLKRFQADPAGFRWDDWKVPAADQSEAPLGNNSTYGSFSDYPRQMLQLFGNVTPMGDAGTPPGERGFPIGIYVRADVWKFDRPSLRNGVFVRWLIVNNSEKVWGKPIDYDKIYMGVDPGYIISGQSPAAYNLPGRGVHIGSGGGMSGRCTNTFPKRAPPGNTEGCEGNATLAPRVIMILKSPLGDLRNKLFTNPTSSYYDPSSPKADDTITFNHWRRGGFGAQDNFSWRRSDRALFGLLSGDEDLWLDGRSATDFSAVNIWRYFRYEFTDGTGDVRNLRYNRSVPGDIPGYGKWDYNDDGIQDTLKVPDCGVAGCSALWSDSIAGGYSNMNAGNIGNFLGFGPFALKAHDTTEVLWYLGAATDTLQTNRLIASVTDAYLKNYAGASAYPAPVVTTNDVQLNTAWFRDSTASSQTTEIRIQVKMPPRRDDAFLASVVDRLTSNDPVAVNLRNLNPDLLATVEGRMRENLAQVLVFKSCDNGVSWTSDVGCTASTGTFRTRDQDGTDVGLGWRPRFTINADTTTGALSTNVVSDVVQAGRDYTYAFVTKTRSLADISVVTRLTTDNSGGIVDLQRDNLQNVLGVDIDSITSSLSPNGPSSVHVYAPISVPAGTIYATLDTVRAQESSTTNRVTADARTASVNGVFRMRFGNRFILTRTIDTSADAHTTTLIRQSLYSRAALSPTDPTFTPNFVAAADTFTANHDITYSARSTQALRTTPRSVTGSVETFVDTLGVAGYVVANGTTGEPYYLAVGTNSSDFRPFASNSGITQSTAEFEGAAWYPGFTVTITAETTNPSPRQSFVLRGPDDTLRSTVVSTNGVVYSVVNPPRGAAVTLGLRDSPGGFFRVHWEDDSFGPNSPFRLTIDPTALETTVNASLSARRVAGTTDTSSKYRATILATADGASSNGANVSSRPLVAAKLPFTMTGPNNQPINLVMFARSKPGDVADSIFRNSRLLGTSGDTARIAVPPDMWLPGDTLWGFLTRTMDSTTTVGGQVVPIMHDTTVGGRPQRLPFRVPREILALKFVMQCASNVSPTRTTCNPIALGTTGQSATAGYLPYQNGFVSVMHFVRPFNQNAEMLMTASPIRVSALPLTNADMDQIHVVPNPFIVQSAYDQIASTRVAQSMIRFVNVPSEGLLRIYSISGQLIQEITWTAADLVVAANGSAHGDLPYNLRTREGLDVSSGLYLYVLTARGPNANGKVARGKFVVIR